MLPWRIDLQSCPRISRFFNTSSIHRVGLRSNYGTLACNDVRTPTAWKKHVRAMCSPTRALRDDYYLNQENCSSLERVTRTDGWRSEGNVRASRIRTQERNWDEFGGAVIQCNCICLGWRALHCLFLILWTPAPLREPRFDACAEVRTC